MISWIVLSPYLKDKENALFMCEKYVIPTSSKCPIKTPIGICLLMLSLMTALSAPQVLFYEKRD